MSFPTHDDELDFNCQMLVLLMTIQYTTRGPSPRTLVPFVFLVDTTATTPILTERILLLYVVFFLK